ncbi:MAG TPA: 2OG-Fe(II) oxygenase [Gammaproteobacteria bacterium]|nr:2OG-Fe(II) oxygenase [Gammaproteobacteria bacterium]
MQGLTPGDRLPDYQRPDPQGHTRMLYDLYSGAPVIVVACDNVASTALRDVLESLDDTSGFWSRFTRIAIVRGTPQQCARLLPKDSSAVTLMVDDGAVLQHLLGTSSGTQAITLFALDSNLNVIERFEPDTASGATELLQRLRALYERRPAPIASVVRQQAPALFIPRVFEPAFCGDLIALFEESGGQPSGVAHIEGDNAYWEPDPSLKIRRDVYLTEGIWLERVRGRLMRRVLPEIKRCFNFQVTQHEVFKLIRYDADTGGYFRPHRDNESRDTRHRRIAMTLNLNTGDYQGGELHFPEFGPALYEAERGGAVVFSCSLLHEAMPVTQGKRYALLGFFFSEAESIAPIQYQSGAQTR